MRKVVIAALAALAACTPQREAEKAAPPPAEAVAPVAPLAAPDAPIMSDEPFAAPAPVEGRWVVEPVGGEGETVPAESPFDFLALFSAEEPGADLVWRVSAREADVSGINTEAALTYACSDRPRSKQPLRFGGRNSYDGHMARAVMNWRSAYANAKAFCERRGANVTVALVQGTITARATLQGAQEPALEQILD